MTCSGFSTFTCSGRDRGPRRRPSRSSNPAEVRNRNAPPPTAKTSTTRRMRSMPDPHAGVPVHRAANRCSGCAATEGRFQRRSRLSAERFGACRSRTVATVHGAAPLTRPKLRTNASRGVERGRVCHWRAAVGHRRRYIPEWGCGPRPELASHEAACILNAGRSDAHVRLTVFFKSATPSSTPSRSARAARSTSASTSCAILSRFPRAWAMPTSSTPTCRSSCSTRAWTLVSPPTP